MSESATLMIKRGLFAAASCFKILKQACQFSNNELIAGNNTKSKVVKRSKQWKFEKSIEGKECVDRNYSKILLDILCQNTP